MHWGVKKANDAPHPKVKAMLESLKGKASAPRSILTAAGKRKQDLRSWPGKKDGDPVWCPEWTLGGCHEQKCNFVHDNTKTPAGYVEWLCKEVQPGVDALIANPVGWVPPRAPGGRPRGRRE